MTVKVIEDPKPLQTSERLVESVNAARSSKAGKMLAERKLESGDIYITADSHETKSLLELEEGSTQVIGGRTKERGRRFTVMAHRVRTNRIDIKNQQKALAELQAQYPHLKSKVKFLKVAWRKATLKNSKFSGPLLIDVGKPEEANTSVLEGLIHDHQPKNCKVFHSECIMTQCYKCWA
jgi:hypothetical protein